MRVAIYTRVSTDEQAEDGFSLDAQLSRLRSYCLAQQYTIFKEYVERGESGRTADRTEYAKMMSECDQWDAILVIKMDRIHRNSRNFSDMMEFLSDRSKSFISMTEKWDTTSAIGRFAMDMVQRIAQLEIEQIGERVQIGMSQKAKTSDNHLGKPAPYGYRLSPSQEAGVEGKYVPITTEADVVRGIFESYLAGDRIWTIAHRLDEQQTPTKRGGRWRDKTVAYILKNRFYAGYDDWNGELRKGRHKSIVSLETYNRVQELMGKRRRNSSQAAKTIVPGVTGESGAG